MKSWVQMLILFFIGLVFILLLAINVSIYDKGQNKARNTLIDQLY